MTWPYHPPQHPKPLSYRFVVASKPTKIIHTYPPRSLPSREPTYPTLGKGKSSSKCHFWRDMLFPRKFMPAKNAPQKWIGTDWKTHFRSFSGGKLCWMFGGETAGGVYDFYLPCDLEDSKQLNIAPRVKNDLSWTRAAKAATRNHLQHSFPCHAHVFSPFSHRRGFRRNSGTWVGANFIDVLGQSKSTLILNPTQARQRKSCEKQLVHPWKLTWNIIMEVWFRSLSFLNGWFVGSM